MTRGSVTQNRSFSYIGANLMSATNPENGTVSYTYDNAHRVATKTDAAGQQTVYTRDIYGRVTSVRYYDSSHNERAAERVDYTYDAGTYGKGHLTGTTFGGGMASDLGATYNYQYTYNQVGRVTGQQMSLTNTQYPIGVTFNAAYTWDTEGRMSSMDPNVLIRSYSMVPIGLGTQTYTYDADGRLAQMGGYVSATATYGPAGEMLSLTTSSTGSRNRGVTTSMLQDGSRVGAGARHDVQLFGDAEQRADCELGGRVDGLGDADGGDHGVHVRFVEPADGGVERELGADVHVRRVRQYADEVGDGRGAVADAVVRRE